MNYNKLRGRITELFGTQTAFASAMNLDPSSLSAKLNNRTPWKREEIEKACEILMIPLEEVHIYFFTPEIEKSHL